MSRLLDLIFSFYREEGEIKEALAPLSFCRLTRSWGSIRIECLDANHLEEITVLIVYLEKPLSALHLCRKIVLSAPGLKQRNYSVSVEQDYFHSQLFS